MPRKPKLPQKTIGLVWYSKDIAELVEMIFAAKGYEVLDYGSSVNALEKMEQKLPDLVFLCNMMLPELSGKEFIKAVRKRWDASQVAIVAASVKDFGFDDVQHLISNYISKPFDLDELIVVIEAAIREKEQKQSSIV